MQNRKSSAVLAILVTISLGIVSVADAWDGLGRLDLKALSARQQVRNAVDSVGSLCGIKQSPRSAIAARQDLQNEVCIAMSDKRIVRPSTIG